MKLNIGSGYKRYDGYINVDCDHHCNPDVVVQLDDINLVLPYEDNSVDEILAHHILEHIGAGFFRLIQEMYRILKPNGIVDIRLPAPWSDIAIIDQEHVRQILPESFRLFSKKHNYIEIERGGSSSTHGIRYDVDFEILTYSFTHDENFYKDIIPQLNEQQIHRLFREGLNVAIESHTVIQAIKD